MFKIKSELRKKWSMYNVSIVDTPTCAIIYNTQSGKICRIRKTPSMELNNVSTAWLVHRGFLVDEQYDEFDNLLKRSRAISEECNHPDIDITLTPSLKCNMRCRYCFENEIRSKTTPRLISSENLKHAENFIIDIANRENVKNLNLTWFGGEPLIHSELLINFSKKIRSRLHNSKQLHVRVITNGSLLSPELLQKLINVGGLESVQISIDGEWDLFSQIRQVDKKIYDKIVDNIILCSNYTQTTLRLNTSPTNVDDIYKFIKKLSDRVTKKENIIFKISEIINYNNDTFFIETFRPGVFRKIYRKLAKYINNLGFNQKWNYIEGYYPLGCKYFYKNNYVIDPDGNLYKCEHHMGEPDFILGNVAYGLKDENMCHHIYYNDGIDNICKTCSLYPVCKYASCHDYRQFLINNQCNIYDEQFATIVSDITENLKYLLIEDIDL